MVLCKCVVVKSSSSSSSSNSISTRVEPSTVELPWDYTPGGYLTLIIHSAVRYCTHITHTIVGIPTCM